MKFAKTHFAILILAAVISISAVHAAEWTDIKGDVTAQDGTPLCAMVLANGQHVFSCDTAGTYSLHVPLNNNGQIDLFAFADGFMPFKAVLGSSQTDFDISMSSASCENSDILSGVYPMTTDNNENGINDYVEETTHFSGSGAVSRSRSPGSHGEHHGNEFPTEPGLHNHGFTDTNSDGICDYAQNGTGTWHGPGFIDADGNGVCDYWDTGASMHNRHQGIWFYDENGNQVNDLYESQWHIGGNHDFADNDGDGICDYAQNGSTTWHGPGFVDHDNDGACDYWQPGGRGHGGQHHGGS